ncbi:MAG: threonine--tRNA ligase [Nitrosopumilus sp.]|nr:threonine--tRNA ligase [Nitrosopumilus sp.]
MRILQLHVDYVEYYPVNKEIIGAEQDIVKEKKRVEETVVILISIEKNDNDESIIKDFIEEVKIYLDKIKCNSILLYPYSHLSSNLDSPEGAYNLLVKIEKELNENLDGIKVLRAPFGWTKELTLKIKGHPLAENSKTFIKREGERMKSSFISTQKENDTLSAPTSSALTAENSLKSFWYILDTQGNLIPIEEYSFQKNDENLKILLNYELSKKRTIDEQPPHVKLMRKLGIADYEPASDSGNMRYYPKGRLIKSLLEQFVTKKVSQYGGLEVETPIMYDSHHPSMESYFNRFPARQYNLKSDQKELFLRFAACFGQFLMAKDFQISYKNLPLKLYELTRYSFRRERSGELVGLRRLRAFSMPDCHAFCKDMEQSKVEFMKRLDLSKSVVEEVGLSLSDDLEMAIRFTEDFYKNNKDFIKQICLKIKKPILVEMWKERFFYFVLKWEFNYIDNLGKASALSTDQIDIENGLRYGITFVDENGDKQNPIILHNSPSGAIERVIFALLEKSSKMMMHGKIPYLPLWLMNTQIRLVPVNMSFIPKCIEISDYFKENNIRVDIDDRDESLSKRIRDAETEWIHYIAIIGEKEKSGNIISIRDRMKKANYECTNEEIKEIISTKGEDKPFLPINLPQFLSLRPKIMT